MRPSVQAIAAAYESAYEQAAGMRDDAREFALRYDADRVLVEFWKPALDQLLGQPAAPPPSLGVFAKDVLQLEGAQ
jgi:hypothetical protein